jgi:excisionase family DNA binding protein
MDDDPLYSIPEVGRRLGGISTSTVERMLSRGDLRRVKVGRRRTMIRASELARVIREEPLHDQPQPDPDETVSESTGGVA